MSANIRMPYPRRSTFLAAALLLASSLHAEKHQQFTVTAAQYLVIPHEGPTLDFGSPASVQSNCRWRGNDVSCSSEYYPETSLPIDFSWLEIYNEVIAGDTIYTITCPARRLVSSCVALLPGETYSVELRDSDWMHVCSWIDGQLRRSWATIVFERSLSTGQPIAFKHRKFLGTADYAGKLHRLLPIYQIMGMQSDPLLHPSAPQKPASQQ